MQQENYIKGNGSIQQNACSMDLLFISPDIINDMSVEYTSLEIKLISLV